MHLPLWALIWIGTMAFFIDYVGLARANDPLARIVSFGSAVVLWTAFAMNATNFAVYSGGTEFELSGNTLPALGLIFGFATFILLVHAVLQGFKEST